MSTFRQLREEQEAKAPKAPLSEPSGTTTSTPAEPDDAPEEDAEGDEGDDDATEGSETEPAGEEPDEGEAGEPDEPEDEPAEEDPEEPEEPEDEDDGELAELRKQNAELREQNAQILAWIQSQQQEKAEGPKAPEKPDPVDEVLEVLYDQRLTKEQREAALSRFTPAVQTEAAARVRQGEDELRRLATKPTKWAEDRVKPLLGPVEQRLAQLEQQVQMRAWSEFLASAKDITDPKDQARLAREIAAGGDWYRSADEIRKDRELAGHKRREEKVARKDARHQARQEARRAQAGRKADQQPSSGKGPRFTGKEKSFSELRQKADRARKEEGS